VGVGGGEANAGVVTAPAYRRRGLATICARAFVEMAHERGLVATWDCDEANPASAALALRVGFIEGEPFNEWAFPERAKPVGVAGLWTVAEGTDGMRIWRRTGE
ncbi:MAG: GNAT family N-acetyltransferase, partial [Chloroflexota bacterium]|nr:GNAT family N-acetyltransferase [Chloroflexota bacterium]